MENTLVIRPEKPARGTNARDGAPPRRILVVEDDRCIREFNMELLGHAGYTVDAAEDGQAGWEALRAHHYDLLITDNNMPRMSGLELVTRLRAAQMTLPVILLSSAVFPEELKRYPSIELAATLRKPYSMRELIETVKQVVARQCGDLSFSAAKG